MGVTPSPVLLNYPRKERDLTRLLGIRHETNGFPNCSKGSCDWAGGQHTLATKPLN